MKELSNAQYNYDIGLRAIASQPKQAKIYTDKVIYTVNKEMSFDIENEQLTSVDHFVGAIASSMLLSFFQYDQKNEAIIEEMEGKFTFHLKNPLAYLHVRGYDETPAIQGLTLKWYVVTYEDEVDFQQMFTEAMENCILYQTVKDVIDISVSFKAII
ncbi:MAG: hypothetical protein Q4A67_01175 [Aerococcus sp.]|nr:hypothetical protein [Aerococcus sp.]